MTYDYRPVGAQDFETICRQRVAMFRDDGRSEDAIARMVGPFGDWLRATLADGAYFGWIAESAGEPVGGLGMIIIPWPPSPTHPSQPFRGYIFNVYVEPAHRGRGVARRLMEMAMDEGRRRDLELMTLHATPMGRPLYEKLGWVAGREMVLAAR